MKDTKHRDFMKKILFLSFALMGLVMQAAQESSLEQEEINSENWSNLSTISQCSGYPFFTLVQYILEGNSNAFFYNTAGCRDQILFSTPEAWYQYRSNFWSRMKAPGAKNMLQ